MKNLTVQLLSWIVDRCYVPLLTNADETVLICFYHFVLLAIRNQGPLNMRIEDGHVKQRSDHVKQGKLMPMNANRVGFQSESLHCAA